jgi:hypothetical protein
MTRMLSGAVFAVSLFLVANVASAQTGMMMSGAQNTSATTTSSAAIGTALQTIYQAQNVSASKQVDCTKVTDTQFEKLGDAYMGYGITEQQHTTMENTMGGDGSTNVQQVHMNMGRTYLGCPLNPKYAATMMDGNNSYGMMSPGSETEGGFGYIFMYLIGAVLLIDLVLAGFWLWKQVSKKK